MSYANKKIILRILLKLSLTYVLKKKKIKKYVWLFFIFVQNYFPPIYRSPAKSRSFLNASNPFFNHLQAVAKCASVTTTGGGAKYFARHIVVMANALFFFFLQEGLLESASYGKGAS